MIGTRKAILLIILIILAVYANSFQNNFVWDDEFLIANNPTIMSWEYAWVHFASDLYFSRSNYYRPIQALTHMADFSLWRLDPFGYHLTNTILHILVSLSLFALLKLISPDGKAAFIGTILYAVHPAHVASVAYIAGRADSLTALFSLLSIMFLHNYFKAQSRRRAVFLYLGSLASFLIALLSKEIAIILPALILCYRLFFISDDEVKKSRNFIRFHYMSPFIVIMGLYTILRINALNFQEAGIIVSQYPLYVRLLTSLKALGLYFGMMFLPLNLHMERYIPYANYFLERDVMLSGILLLLIIWSVVRARRISKPAFFGFLFFLISLVPVINIYPLRTNMAEHWLYIPLMGITIFLSCLGRRLWDARRASRPVLLFLIIFYLIFFSYRTIARNRDWRDEDTIYNHTLNHSPTSIKMLNNVGNLYHREGDYDMAMMFYKKALRVNPHQHRSYFNLGHTYEAMGMTDMALRQYKKSILCKPDYARAYFNRGNIYAEEEEYDKAIAAYGHAAEYNDLHIGARNNLGNIYFEWGLYEKAREKYEEALKLNTYMPETHNNLGNVMSELGRYEEAIESYKKAVELEPENADYHSGLGTLYGKLGRLDEALKELGEAYRLKPRNAETLINIGVVYFHRGDISSAKKEWYKALLVDPGNKITLGYLENISP